MHPVEIVSTGVIIASVGIFLCALICPFFKEHESVKPTDEQKENYKRIKEFTDEEW